LLIASAAVAGSCLSRRWKDIWFSNRVWKPARCCAESRGMANVSTV